MTTKRQALEALFDEGVNFADYDEGKKRSEEPDGYFDGGEVEVRRRAVDRAMERLGLDGAPGSKVWGSPS
jgi:hypothetical protein